MQPERVTDDIFIFTSELYAQVTAGVIITSVGAIIIDTLAYPQETKRIKRFVQEHLDLDVKYVVNTHYHADHTTGTCFFPGVSIIAHEKCREFLNIRGRESLENARGSSSDMDDVELILPDMVFDKQFTLFIGNKTLRFMHTPGHSMDLISCIVEEDQVLFASDSLMPIPYFVDGSFDDTVATLKKFQEWTFESIVQGHGEVVLRGEIKEKLADDLSYLSQLSEAVDNAIQADNWQSSLDKITVDDCGKSRVLMNGMVGQLHRQNVIALAEQRHIANGVRPDNSV